MGRLIKEALLSYYLKEEELGWPIKKLFLLEKNKLPKNPKPKIKK